MFQGVESIRWGAEVELLEKTWMEVETGSMLKCMCMCTCMCLTLRQEAINNTCTMKEALVDGKV